MTDWQPRVTIPNKLVYSWESQARQYLNRGDPNSIRYQQHSADGVPVDCLLYFDGRGLLVGILNHYPTACEPEQAGNVNVWVHPRFQCQGIGSALVRAAARRWEINREQQRYTRAGVALLRALERGEEP